MSFGHAVQTYTAHARSADRLTSRARVARLVVLVLIGVAAAASVVALVVPARGPQITAAIAAALAFGAHAIVAAIDWDGRATAHRICAGRLWLVTERYRALLSEIQDGVVEGQDISSRRDALMQQVQSIYEQAPPFGREAYAAAADAVSARARPALTEAQIDELLPPTLKKQTQAEPQS
ncbi:MAG TPA: SLATT domain-containing protein [Vicinamibacterales bacterium]|nr:SLATT domain-containing protein [Vicinamibacterales bacterium]